MANQFKFKSQEVELDIAGKLFTINLAEAGSVDRILAFGYEAIQKADKLKAVPITGTPHEKALKTKGVIDEAINFTIEAVDKILGEGAVDKIFEGRRKDFLDVLDVLGYVLEEVKSASTVRVESYIGQYTNRAQKRAATKSKKK